MTAAVPPAELRDAVSGLGIAAAWVGICAMAFSGWAQAPVLAVAGLALFAAPQLRAAGRMAHVHLTVGAGFALVAVLLLADPGPALFDAAVRGAFIAVIFAALGTLRAAAQGAGWVVRTARMLVRQPPGRRYWAIAGGGSLFGAILSFGSVPLLAGMIQDANGPAARTPAERPMMTALLRGFSVVMFWCPTSMAFAIATATLPAASWTVMSLLGAGCAVLVLTSGRLLDRRSGQGGIAAAEPEAFSARKLAPLLGLLALIFALAAALEAATGSRLIDGAILCVPLLALGWLTLAQGRAGPGRLVRWLARDTPAQRGEILILVNAAFVGMIVAALAPPSLVDAALAAVPAALIAPLALVLIVVLGMLGVNPLVTATALAATVADAPSAGVSPTLLGAAITIAWGLAVGSSPGAAATLMIGRFEGATSAEVGLRWNGAHTWTAMALVSGVLMLLHPLL